jgi:hypothetical protein
MYICRFSLHLPATTHRLRPKRPGLRHYRPPPQHYRLFALDYRSPRRRHRPTKSPRRRPEPLAPLSGVTLLRPTDDQEIWAAGVTYERSRVAIEEEIGRRSAYRPRLQRPPAPKFSSTATSTRVQSVYGTEEVAIRQSATWNVPNRSWRSVHSQPSLRNRRLSRGQRHELPRHRRRKPALPAPSQNVRALLCRRSR